MLSLVTLSGCDDLLSHESNKAAPSKWETLYKAWKYPQPVPAFELIDQAGRRFSLGRYRGQYLLVGFVFSRCGMPKACPLTMRKMREVQDALAKAQPALNLKLLSLTLDPAYDKPPVLAAWAKRVGADPRVWTLATGEQELMTQALPSLFNVLALPDPESTVQHTVKVALLGPDLRLVKEWKDNAFTTEEILRLVQSR